jgi:hypothetical protein
MGALEQRVRKLEEKMGNASSRMHVVLTRPDQSDDEALAAAGLQPGPQDLVVFINQFGDGPFESRRPAGRII